MLDKISIGIKTFLRDEHLLNTLFEITEYMPEVQLVVADDGYTSKEKEVWYGYLKERGDQVIKLPFDSGFGKKSNCIVQSFHREYLLVGSDDFDFSPETVREGIIQLAEVLEQVKEISIASGRVWNRHYEFDLFDQGNTIIEMPVYIPKYATCRYVECDLTVNYSLIRKQVFDKVGWDDDVKIGGGEHGAFFVDCKRAGFKTCYVPGVNINEQTNVTADPDYRNYRRRASNPERPCFDKRGITKYVLGNGQVDYDATSRS